MQSATAAMTTEQKRVTNILAIPLRDRELRHALGHMLLSVMGRMVQRSSGVAVETGFQFCDLGAHLINVTTEELGDFFNRCAANDPVR